MIDLNAVHSTRFFLSLLFEHEDVAVIASETSVDCETSWKSTVRNKRNFSDAVVWKTGTVRELKWTGAYAVGSRYLTNVSEYISVDTSVQDIR
jgi:hypothetical protein